MKRVTIILGSAVVLLVVIAVALWWLEAPLTRWEAMLRSQDAAARLQALRDLERLPRIYVRGWGEQGVVRALVRTLRDDDPQIRLLSARVFVNLMEDATEAAPGLVQALRDEDGGVRAAAAMALRYIKPDPAVALPPLRESLNDGDKKVRLEAAWSFGVLGGNAEAFLPVFQEAAKDPDPAVRLQLVWALGDVGAVTADKEPLVPLLVASLQDQGPKVREVAAKGLERTGPAARAAVPSLLQSLKDSNELVRWESAQALGAVGAEDERVLPALSAALLDDPDDFVREGAAMGLWNMGPRAVGAVPALLKALRDRSSGVRARAAEALGPTGSAEAVPALVQALQDANSPVRWRAAQALGLIGQPSDEAMNALRVALSDPERDVREAADTALIKLKARRDGR
jgi:HEAT repeat protein